MKKLFFILFTLCIVSVSNSQNVHPIENSLVEMAENEFKTLEYKLKKVNPGIIFDANQKTRLKAIFQRKSKDIKEAIADGMDKSEWIRITDEINKKYENEILRNLNLDQRKAFQNNWLTN